MVCALLCSLTHINIQLWAKAEVFWDAASAIVVPVIGIMAFNDSINIIGWGGITLIIIGTLILGFEKELMNYLHKK